MRLRKKIFLGFLIVALLVLASLIGAILYLYYHPSSVRPFLEKSISRSTGGSFTIDELSYSIKPMRIHAKGIALKPLKNQRGPHLELPELVADLTLEGPFGHKSLIFKMIKIEGFSLHLSREMNLPQSAQKRKTPSFFTRALKGAIGLFLFEDIQFQSAEVIHGQIVAHLGEQMFQVREIDAKLRPDQRIGISCNIQMRWPSRRMSFTAPGVHITTDHAVSFTDPKIEALLVAEKVAFESETANVKQMGVKAKLIYTHNRRKLAFEPMGLHLKGVSLKQIWMRDTAPLDLELNTEGFFDLRNNRLGASHFHLDVMDMAQLEGRLNLDLGPQFILKLEDLDCHVLPQKLLPLLTDRTQAVLAPFNLSGSVNIYGGISGLKERQKWSWQCDLEARLKENQISYRSSEIQLQGMISGNIQAEGKLPGPRISVKIKGDKVGFSGKGMELKPFKASLSLSGRHPTHMIEDLTAHIPQAKVAVGKRDLLIDDIKLRIQNGKLDEVKKSLILPQIQLDSSLLKNLLLSLEADGKQVIVQLQGKEVHLIEAASVLNLLPSGWQISGVDSIQTKAVIKEKGGWSFISNIGFRDFGFESPNSHALGEKISITARLDCEGDLKASYIAANTTLEVHDGEVLFDRFYLDLNSNAFSSSFKGKYDIHKKSLRLSSLRLELKDILALDVNGTLLHNPQDTRFQLSLIIPKTPLKPAFHHFIFEPFKTENPFLNSLNVGGILSANLNFRGNRSDWTVMGHCRWHEGELSSKDKGFSFQGIDLDLPIWHQPRRRKKAGEPMQGELSIQPMILPFLPKQSLAMELEAGPNQLSIRSPTILRLPGGEIQLGPTVCRDIFLTRPSIETSLALDSVDLQPLLSRYWSRSIEGRIGGKLKPIHSEGGRIRSLGEIKARVFGGEIILSGFGATGIFTSAPAFELSAQLNDLNLAEMTAGTSFGKIDGILRGHIRDLEIASGQPQRFDLLLETVKKKGLPQKISVQAVDNISQLGGGQSPFVGFAGTFASFFREFPYRKIGIRASLKNDVFRINGTIREQGKEYLVKRSGFAGVNVVNQNPDNRISFKDMVKRIKRVSAAGRGPVVK